MLESMRVATTPAKCAMSVRVGPKLVKLTSAKSGKRTLGLRLCSKALLIGRLFALNSSPSLSRQFDQD